MKKHVFGGLFLTGILCGLLTFSALAATQARVVGGWLRLRSGPSLRAETLASYPSGALVTVFRKAYGWAQVTTSDGRSGYMAEEFLVPVQSDRRRSSAQWTAVNETAHVISRNGKGVRLRSAPMTGNNVLGLYPVGRTVLVIRQSSDGWSFIRIDQKYGYMMSEFLSIGSTDEMRPVRSVPVTRSVRLQGIRLSSRNPRVGDRLTVSTSPAGAPCTMIWYRDDHLLLSTSNTYTVRAEDAGHVIQVRVSGEGDSSEINLNESTNVVRAAASAALSAEDESAGSDASAWDSWGSGDSPLLPDIWPEEDPFVTDEMN